MVSSSRDAKGDGHGSAGSDEVRARHRLDGRLSNPIITSPLVARTARSHTQRSGAGMSNSVPTSTASAAANHKMGTRRSRLRIVRCVAIRLRHAFQVTMLESTTPTHHTAALIIGLFL